MKARTKKIVIPAILVAVLVVALWLSGRETRTSHFSVQFDGDQAQVTVTWVLPWSVSIGPQYLAKFGNDEYKTLLELKDGTAVKFSTNREPKAIWRLHDSFYLACFSPSEEWMIVKLENGTPVPVAKKDLPPGDKPWNLVPKERASEWQADFDRWAK